MIIIFRGASGIFKTTLANYLLGETIGAAFTDHRTAPLREYLTEVRNRIPPGSYSRKHTLFSADDYYTDQHGIYSFDPALLSRAHGSCLQRFTEALTTLADKRIPLIVDNTNTTIAEVAPYCGLAGAYDQELHVITLLATDLASCAMRNRHGTPASHIIKQQLALEESIRQWPAWWPQQIFAV